MVKSLEYFNIHLKEVFVIVCFQSVKTKNLAVHCLPLRISGQYVKFQLKLHLHTVRKIRKSKCLGILQHKLEMIKKFISIELYLLKFPNNLEELL